jgi:hypothetical protein
MKAKVKANYRWATLIALSGIEFNKKEFTLVPPPYEQEALRNPNLEIESAPQVVEKVHIKTEAASVVVEEEIKPVSFARRGNKKSED